MSISKTKTKKQRIIKNEKGQSLVELAIGIVILFMILGGIVDLGRAIFTRFALQDAAEEGIVYGVGFPRECDEIKSRVQSNLTDNILPASNVVLKINGSEIACDSPYNVAYGDKMDITVNTDFTITMPFLGALTGQTINLAGTANGVILRPQPTETP